MMYSRLFERLKGLREFRNNHPYFVKHIRRGHKLGKCDRCEASIFWWKTLCDNCVIQEALINEEMNNGN